MCCVQAMKASLRTECKCHGVSGSCTMKTCWRTLPSFRQVGDLLLRKYWRARAVRGVPAPGGGVRLLLRRRRSGGTTQPPPPPRRADLVFLQDSPNYCEPDPARGSLGTQGRQCNRTSSGKLRPAFLLR
ncbi:hypothetical protein PR048_026898 [Dryococelus australis]|uniref:Protein Wnt n=1 Tax=Dryococelus australis TaxID=614101 RepID=A0ABQ9GMN1_9NEOP|nr:hypothetical protein PR048_026898 [Dryococelus australis]